MHTNRDNEHRTRDSVIETLANAVFEMASSNASLSKDIQDLIARIDILTGVVVNAQKSRAQTNTIFPITKDNFPNAVVMMVVLALVVLAISLKGCGNQPTFEIADYSSEESSDDTETWSTDTETWSTDTETWSTDTETEALDTDTDTETDTVSCPWDCAPITTPSHQTCDEYDITVGNPESVRNYNHDCPGDEWCCQPWPPASSDLLALTEHCDDDPETNCVTACPGSIITDKVCDHPAAVCCQAKGDTDDTAQYSPSNDG